jgi:hypothetical protein
MCLGVHRACFKRFIPGPVFVQLGMQATFFALHGELIGFAGFVNNNQDVIRRWQRRSSICITARRFPVRGYFLLIFGTCFSIVGSFWHFLFLWIVRVCFTTP